MPGGLKRLGVVVAAGVAFPGADDPNNDGVERVMAGTAGAAFPVLANDPGKEGVVRVSIGIDPNGAEVVAGVFPNGFEDMFPPSILPVFVAGVVPKRLDAVCVFPASVAPNGFAEGCVDCPNGDAPAGFAANELPNSPPEGAFCVALAGVVDPNGFPPVAGVEPNRFPAAGVVVVLFAVANMFPVDAVGVAFPKRPPPVVGPFGLKTDVVCVLFVPVVPNNELPPPDDDEVGLVECQHVRERSKILTN